MPNQAPPKAEMTVDLTKKEFVTAALIAARRSGALRSFPLTVIVSALLLTCGMCSIGWFQSSFLSILVPVLLCAACPLLLLLCFVVEPAAIRRRAMEDYAVYERLMQPMVVCFYDDYAVSRTPRLTFTDQYALLVECIETPALLVFIRDRERRLVVPKRCLPAETQEETLTFLRMAFTRHRRVMRSWLF